MNDEQTPALRQAVENMANMREAYDNLSQAAEAYNTGKTELAANITAKGVQASATETLPELAAKVRDIQQEQTILQGGDVYAQQLFGNADAAVSPLWNLYEVLAQMKSQFMGAGHYVALIVCEYYKGYDSLQLQGADAYYTCDGDYYDYASPNHVWHDADNGKMNRWVAFLYRDEGARLDITNTAISPRSMYIGGHIGTIEYFTNGRLTELVCGVEETDVLDSLITRNYTNPFGFSTSIRNIKSLLGKTKQSEGFLHIKFIGDETITSEGLSEGLVVSGVSYIQLEATKFIHQGGYAMYGGVISGANSAICIYIDAECDIYVFSSNGTTISLPNLISLYIKKINSGKVSHYSMSAPNLIDVAFGELEHNMYISWNPTTVLADADKKTQLIENIKNHILARVSDATGSTQLVFTVSTNMYNNIASEQIEWQGETMSLADAFLTKNWLLAGA